MLKTVFFQEKSRVDLSSSGRVWSLLTRPNGGVLALTWEVNKVGPLSCPHKFLQLPPKRLTFHELSQPAHIVNVNNAGETWQLPDSLNNQ